MSIADDLTRDAENPLFEREDLARTVELILEGDEDAPEILARLLVSFRLAIDGGLRGINDARNALVTAVELIYLHSGAHASALSLYRLSLEGHLKIEDEPVNLINAAVKRGARIAARHADRRAGRRRSRS
ncbi:MAG TPA: hypothetical protein VM934_07450 [Pyrinomonadaceae bacterium]|nr:hypothetical protein [Pyrinomonadaceae bacterium]